MTREPDAFEEHLQSPVHCGKPATWTHHGEAINPLCGDRVALWLQVDQDTIQQARFTNEGCAVSRAGASLLCERIKGQSLTAAISLTDGELLECVGITLTPTRRQCLLLSLEALRRLVEAPPVATNAGPA